MIPLIVPKMIHFMNRLAGSLNATITLLQRNTNFYDFISRVEAEHAVLSKNKGSTRKRTIPKLKKPETV